MKTFFLLVLAAVQSIAQDRPDARDLLARADAAIFTAKTVRLTATKSEGFASAPPLPSNSYQFEFVHGGKARAEYLAGGSQITLIVFDGATEWAYHTFGNQYTKKSAAAWTRPSELATLDYGRLPANILSATYEGDEAIDFRGGRVDCSVVLAKYSRAPGLMASRDIIRRVWIAKNSELILRDYWEGTDPSGIARRAATTNYINIETDIELPDDRFVFQPPPGSKEGAPMVLGGIIGPIPSSRDTLQKRVAAAYSPEARAAGLQGSVILNIEVEPDGSTQDPRILHGLGMGLDEKAIEAVTQWRYGSESSPTARALRRVVEVPFRLRTAGPWILDGSEFRAQAGGGSKPQLVQYASPDAAACSAQGYVEAAFQIGADGVPSDIQPAADAGEGVRESVVTAVRAWRFRPESPGSARVLLECHPPAPPTVRGQSYASTVVVAPTVFFKVEPEYSEEARKAKLQGQVGLSLIVEVDGKVSSAQVYRHLAMGLDEQATAAVLQWRFKPATKDGQVVRSTMRVSVEFKLP